MREILFRSFHPCDGPDTIVVDGEKVKGEWLYGFYWNETVLNGEKNHWIYINTETPGGTVGHPVLPSTVGQWTGLTDKNGKRIFEGDIVDDGADFSEEEGYGVVQWNDGAFEVIGNGICGTFHENYWGKDFEVIGTVFDGEANNET